MSLESIVYKMHEPVNNKNFWLVKISIEKLNGQKLNGQKRNGHIDLLQLTITKQQLIF